MKMPKPRITVLDCCLAVIVLAIAVFLATSQCAALANWDRLVQHERAIFKTDSREFVEPTTNQ